jgi:septum formation topological specificity factor MinE
MTDELKQWEYDRGYEKGKADVLDKIRAEISDMFKHETQDDYWDGYESCRADVLQIIDKYTKGESE